MKRRNTPIQTEILHILKSSDGALSHEMLQVVLDKKIDRATIYRVLNRCCEDGLVHSVLDDNGRQYFAYCAGCDKPGNRHNHHHFTLNASDAARYNVFRIRSAFRYRKDM